MASYYVYGLYAINRPKGSLFYLGKGKNNRYLNHYQASSTASKTNSHKNSVIANYKTFPMPICGGLQEEFAFKLESLLISIYKKQLTNKSDGGEGNSGYRHSLESKQKMSMALIGKNVGKKHSEETRDKISQAKKGCPGPKGTIASRLKQSQAPKGKPKSKQQTAKISGKNNVSWVCRHFIQYHLWSQSISGVTAKEYCVNKPFTYAAFCNWKCKNANPNKYKTY